MGPDELSARIKQAREDSRLTQRELSDLVGVTQRNIAHYEAGSKRPRQATLERIASATGRSVGWFYLGDPQTHNGYPIALCSAEWTGGSWQITVRQCPYCAKTHYHGGGNDPTAPGLGHRVTHCVSRHPHDKGYWLVSSGKSHSQDDPPTPQAPPIAPAAVTPDLAAIVAQAVGQAVSQALEPLVQAQVQMQEAMAALARERMESRAEMARTQRKIREMENDLRQMGEEDDEEDCPGQKACSG